MQKLSEIWRKVQGSDSWKGLTAPTMSTYLRSELLKYGDMVRVCRDAFDPTLLADAENQFGGCKYSTSEFFEKRDIKCGYTVTKYLYAGTDGPQNKAVQSVWMGYIAVCSDDGEIERIGRRDIVVAWRGTRTKKEWMKNLCFAPAKAASTLHGVDENIRIQSGFLSIYTSYGQDGICLRDCLHKEIMKLVNLYKGQGYPMSITFAGHSMGAALATLAAYDVKESLTELLEDIPVTVFSYGGPKVGNKAFVKRVREVGLQVLRVENKQDLVPKAPANLPGLKTWSYYHAGVVLVVDNLVSPYLKPKFFLSSLDFLGDISSCHDLGVYLHLLDGYEGEGLPFRKPSRDIRLVRGCTEDILVSL